ncbi:MAG: 16S rRNA (uracil(1498)-N(3))-methyltransferase [Thermodesulfobacteriota bacterium]
MRRFFIPRDRVQGPAPFLDGDEARHMIQVLRRKPGDRVVLFDDSDHEFQARIASITATRVFLEISEQRTIIRESPLRITLGVPLIRSQPLDWMLQKGTELGVTAFRPFFSRFSRRNFEKTGRDSRLDHSRKILIESVKQCGRNVLPRFFPAVSFSELLELEEGDLKFIPYENETCRTLKDLHRQASPPHSVTVLIGPEGGFSEEEHSLAGEKGFVSVSLGPRILRSETAALTFISMLQFLWGDMGGSGNLADFKE